MKLYCNYFARTHVGCIIYNKDHFASKALQLASRLILKQVT